MNSRMILGISGISLLLIMMIVAISHLSKPAFAQRDADIEELRELADYLERENLLFSKIKPIFERGPKGEYVLVIPDAVSTEGQSAPSIKALNLHADYLLDAQSCIKELQKRKAQR